MEKITDKKQIRNMTFLFMILYLISYLTRINYAAIISEIVIAEGIQKSVASLALTASAITYGIGQLLSGYMGDRIEPKKLIFGGLLTTLTTNLLITLCSSPYQMAVVWGINGCLLYTSTYFFFDFYVQKGHLRRKRLKICKKVRNCFAVFCIQNIF